MTTHTTKDPLITPMSARALELLRFMANEREEGPEGNAEDAFAELLRLWMIEVNEGAKDGEDAYPLTAIGRAELEERAKVGAPRHTEDDDRALVKAEIAKLLKAGDGVTIYGVDIEACLGFEYLVNGERVPSARVVEHIMQVYASARARSAQ
jgi:hypothetical protein